MRFFEAHFGGPFSSRNGRTRTITALSFLSQQIEKQPDRFLFVAEMMDYHLTSRSNAAPLAKQANIPEQVWLNRHRIVASHVSRCIGTFDVEVVGLRDHETRIADPGGCVQRHL